MMMMVILYNIFYFRNEDNKMYVRVGSQISTEGGRLHKVSTVIYHPEFNYKKLSTDVAVVKVRNSVAIMQGYQGKNNREH